MKRLLSIILGLIMIIAVIPAVPASAASAEQTVYLKVTQNYDNAYKVLNLINKERKAEGLKALVMNESLLKTAMLRAAECQLFWSHVRPNGESCFSANKLMYGENLGFGITSPETVVDMWMDSSAHRANIMNPDFKTIGIGCVSMNGEPSMWSQNFGVGKDSSSCAKPKNQTLVQPVKITTGTVAKTKDGKALKYKAYMTYSPSWVYADIYPGTTTEARVYFRCENYGGNYIEDIGVTWSSSNPDIATVDSEGKIRTLKEGCTYITAQLKHYTVTAKFIVSCKNHEFKQVVTKATPQKNGSYITECITCRYPKESNPKTIYRPKTIQLSKANYTYNGKVKTPKVTVKLSNGKTLDLKHYDVTYQEGRKEIGTYKVTITFKGDKYTGQMTRTFKVVPAGTSLTKVTGKKASMTLKWKKQKIQTSGYQIRYSTKTSMKGAKILTVKGSKKTIKNLKSNKKYYVQVRTYKTINDKKYCSSWSAKKTVKTK